MDYEIHGPVVSNLGCENVVHVDFENYCPVVRNLGDDYVFLMDSKKHSPVVRNLGVDAADYRELKFSRMRKTYRRYSI